MTEIGFAQLTSNVSPIESDEIDKIIPALIDAQGEFTKAIASRENDYYDSKFVGLVDVLAAVGPALREHRIAIVQQTAVEGDDLVLFTRLIHESGQWLGSRYPIKPVKADPQGVGSALTYARRYSLMALVGIAPEDDDGNAAGQDESHQQQSSSRRQQRQSAPPPPPSDTEDVVKIRDGYLARMNEAKTTADLAAVGSEIAGDRRLPREASAQLKAVFDERMATLAEAEKAAEPAGNGRSRGRSS